MEKTNINLVEYCKKALSEGWYYGWGAHGQKATTSVVNSLVKQYPSSNTKWKAYMTKAVQNKTSLCDCYGLVKGFLGKCETGEIKLLSKYDINTGMAFGREGLEKGPLSTLPELPGVILYMKGHVGVYIGNGEFIECAGGGTGMFKGKIENGKVTKGSKFTHWFKEKNITYIEPESNKKNEQAKEQTEIEEENNKVAVIIGNKEVSLEGFIKNDYNYVKLRDIVEVLGYEVEYDHFTKIPILYKMEEEVGDEI